MVYSMFVALAVQWESFGLTFVSKGKSVVAAMRPFGEVALPPREFLHTNADLSKLTESLRLIDGSTRVIMDATGRYHEPVVSALRAARIYVSVVNPKLIKDFGNNSLRFLRIYHARVRQYLDATEPLDEAADDS